MRFLLETKSCNDEELGLWKAAFRETGTNITYYNGYYLKGDHLDLFHKGELVTVFGSIGFCRSIAKKTDWIPPIYPLDHHIYDCNRYYPILYNYLLNKDFCFLPYKNFIENKELYQHLWNNGYVFVRPNSSIKIFAGGIVDLNNIQSDFDLLFAHSGEVDADTICLISSPKNIKKEWRLVCHNETIVTSSLYKENGKIKLVEGCSEKARIFAEKVLRYYKNNTYFTLDLCEVDGTIHVLEVGGLSYAGLYHCNRSKIIQHILENYYDSN